MQDKPLDLKQANFSRLIVEKIAEKPDNIEFYRAKVRTAEFYFEHIFPRTKLLAKTMMADPKSLMRMTSDQF